MSKFKILMGATALVSATAAFAGSANAVNTYLYGAGSSLVAPYMRQALDCYGHATPLVIKGSALNNPTYSSPPVAFFDYTGSPAQNCAPSAHQEVDLTVQGDYESTGSGTGLKAYISHSPSTYVGDFVPGQDPSPYPAFTFAGSETAFGEADVTAYNSGGTDPTTGIVLGNGQNAQFPTPAPLYGPMIQVPLLIAPVTLAYSAEYGRFRASDGTIHHYYFNVHSPRADGSGGLHLDAATYCAIFNGQVSDWNQIPTSLNANKSLQSAQDKADGHTFSVPLVLVGRSDGSGTTSVFTRHMAAQCPAVISGTVYQDSTSTLPPSLVAATWTKTNPNYGSGSGVTDVPGEFTVASGSDGVADYLYFDPNNVPAQATGSEVLQGRIGYVGPDYVLPAVLSTGNNTFGLETASLIRPGTTAALSPTVASAVLAYNGITPPTGSNLSDPSQWVQPASKSATIAIPTDIRAYPIVGTSNFVTYTCYDDADRPGTSSAINAFMTWYWTSQTVNDKTAGILAEAGLGPMPTSWKNAIRLEFFEPSAKYKANHLWATFAGNTAAPQCASVSPGA